MKSELRFGTVLFGLAMFLAITPQLYSQTSRWAAADDPTARQLIEWERLWAESGCSHNGIEKTILAEDFHAIAPDGSQYGKKEALAKAQSDGSREKSCVMYGVNVHYFGETMAVLYGSESAVTTDPAGKEVRLKLTWVDTWLKRNGQWQVVAAEDMPSKMK